MIVSAQRGRARGRSGKCRGAYHATIFCDGPRHIERDVAAGIIEPALQRQVVGVCQFEIARAVSRERAERADGIVAARQRHIAGCAAGNRRGKDAAVGGFGDG